MSITFGENCRPHLTNFSKLRASLNRQNSSQERESTKSTSTSFYGTSKKASSLEKSRATSYMWINKLQQPYLAKANRNKAMILRRQHYNTSHPSSPNSPTPP